MIDRPTATERIRAARVDRGVTLAEVARVAGTDRVFATSVLEGQNVFTPGQAAAVGELLDLDPDTVAALTRSPWRGSLPAVVPTDPLVYRFYEVLSSYGSTLKAVIEEEFGDGIMSAIDFTLSVERHPDPHGDRVVVTLDGKFLPYRRW